jgi:Heterokaryon incompatibility protein (HET)
MVLTHHFGFLRNHARFHLHRLVRVARVLRYLLLSCLTPRNYTYKPLKQNYIRILEILPSNDYDSPVTCRLHVTSLGLPRLPYVAISYAWGDQDVERIAIVCDGRRALVTPNLHSILVRLRGLNIHWVWVDGLCIDQGSDEKAQCERAEQVALMSQIFPFAQKVVVDLGELSESDRMFFEYVKLYEAIPQETWAAAWGTTGFPRNMAGLDSLKLPSRDSHFWPAFVQFMQRSWFNRLWVVQEYALAMEVQIMLGRDLHGPEFLESTLYRIFRHAMFVAKFSAGSVDWERHVQLNRMYRLIRKPCGAMNTILSMRRSHLAMSMGSPEWRVPFKENLGFCELFDATRMFDYTDWHDRVYGVLGLACDAEAVIRSIPVDYKLGKKELSVRVSTYFISQGSSAYVLYNCRGQMASRGSSWALNLLPRREDPLVNLMNMNGSCRGEVFKACGSTAVSLTITSHGTAITKGSILGEIASMTNTYPLVAIDVEIVWQLEKKLVDWVQGIERWMECQGRRHSLPASEFRKQCQITLMADLIDLDYRPQRGSKVEGHAERVAEAWIQVVDDNATATSTSLSSEAVGSSENGEIAPSTSKKDVKAHPPQVSRCCQQELKRHIQDDVLQSLYKYLLYAKGRRLAISTDDELVCCVPGQSQVGDHVCVLFGCHIPFVVRKDSDSDRFSMVGPCYIHHMMDGQALSSPSWNPLEIELI